MPLGARASRGIMVRGALYSGLCRRIAPVTSYDSNFCRAYIFALLDGHAADVRHWLHAKLLHRLPTLLF